jgi:hypothetical protein
MIVETLTITRVVIFFATKANKVVKMVNPSFLVQNCINIQF